MAENVKTLNIGEGYVSDNGYFADDVPVMDIRYGGQWGALPRIGGIDNGKPIHEWMHEQSYIRENLIAIVLETPKVFDLFPRPEIWKAAVKAMFEVHAKEISGLDSSLTVNSNNRDLGISGATLNEPTNVTRASVNVSLTLDEKAGIPFEILHDLWIRYGIMDPDLGIPLITKIVSPDKLPKARTIDFYSATVMFIEPDPFYRTPVHAWLVSNLYPQGNPEIVGSKKDKNSDKDVITKTIEFGGFALPPTNVRVMKLAKKILNNLELWAKDPEDILLPSDKVMTDIADINDMAIYYDGVKPGTESAADGSSGSATD